MLGLLEPVPPRAPKASKASIGKRSKVDTTAPEGKEKDGPMAGDDGNGVTSQGEEVTVMEEAVRRQENRTREVLTDPAVAKVPSLEVPNFREPIRGPELPSALHILVDMLMSSRKRKAPCQVP